MRFTPSSLRNRLVLGAFVVGIAFAVVFGLVATWRIKHAESQAVHAALLSRAEIARDEIAANGSISQDAGSPKTDLVQVIGPDGRIRASSPALARAAALVDVATVQSSSSGVEVRRGLQNPDIELAVYAVPVTLVADGSAPAGTGALVVAVDAEGFNSASSQLLWLLIAGLGAVALAMAALAWILTGRALSSVTRLTEDAEAVRPHDLGTGLPVPRGDAELARLVEALNRMLERLHQSHAAQLAFAADAGHRLRTPVATLRAEAELALRETDPDAVTSALERVVHDADQLTSIVDRMLARTRPGGHGSQPVREVLAQASERWHRQAMLAGAAFTLAVDDEITGATRTVEVAEILEPIIDNAVRHTPVHGQVDVRARLEARALVVSVANTGEPIAADVRPFIFDAWVSTRDASAAGGLGLWLARETARDLGGDVELAEDVPDTTFRITIPLTDAI